MGPSSQAQGHGGWSYESRHSSRCPPPSRPSRKSQKTRAPHPRPRTGLKVPLAPSPSSIRERCVSPPPNPPTLSVDP